MKYRHSLAILGVTCAPFAWSSTAKAQDHRVRDTESGYAVEFADSDLLGHSLSLEGYRIRIRDPQARVLLIRPRASFVPELHASIEHM